MREKKITAGVLIDATKATLKSWHCHFGRPGASHCLRTSATAKIDAIATIASTAFAARLP